MLGFSFLILASVRKYDIHIYKEQKIRTNEISMIDYIWEKVNTVANKTNKKYDVMSVV